jgi:hypothetical protein
VRGRWHCKDFGGALYQQHRSQICFRLRTWRQKSQYPEMVPTSFRRGEDGCASDHQVNIRRVTNPQRHMDDRWRSDFPPLWRVLALTRENTGKVRKLFFSESIALEDKAMVLRRNLSVTDRQQAIRTDKFGAEVEKLYEMANRLRAKLENCYVKFKRYTVCVAEEERKNSKFRKRSRRPRTVRRSKIAGP